MTLLLFSSLRVHFTFKRSTLSWKCWRYQRDPRKMFGNSSSYSIQVAICILDNLASKVSGCFLAIFAEKETALITRQIWSVWFRSTDLCRNFTVTSALFSFETIYHHQHREEEQTSLHIRSHEPSVRGILIRCYRRRYRGPLFGQQIRFNILQSKEFLPLDHRSVLVVSYFNQSHDRLYTCLFPNRNIDQILCLRGMNLTQIPLSWNRYIW